MNWTESNNYAVERIATSICINKGSLIDFETSGLMRNEEHEVVSFGSFVSNKILIIGRKTKNKSRFYNKVKGMLKSIPKPIYAYNAEFEKEIIRSEFGIKFRPRAFIDLQRPWRPRADLYGAKWPKLDELISEPKFFGEIQVTGKDVPGLWKAYLSSGSILLLRMIMRHNLMDLLRETILLFLNPEIYEVSAR